MSDYPDYTIPVVTIGDVTVIGTVAVSGTVTVSGAVTVTGTVAISGTVTVTGTVAISGTVTVSGAVTVTGTVAISGTVTVSGAVTVSGTVAVSGTVTVSGTVAVSGTVTVSGAVTVSGTVAVSGTVTISGTVAISGTVTISGAVTITSGSVTFTNTTIAVTGTVAISGTVTISGAVTVTGTTTISGAVTITSGSVTFTNTTIAVTGTVAVSGTVTITGTVAISGTVTISGAVTVTGTVTISGAVTITSGAVTITTTGGTNIIIDKLVQGAYTENRVTIINDGTPTGWSYASGANRGGKFFPRGMRGVIARINILCRDGGAAGGTLTVYIAPYIGAGYIYSENMNIPAGCEAAWRGFNLYKQWNYDSMFIFLLGSSDNMQYGLDTSTPYDAWESADNGATWAPTNYRFYIRPIMYGQTVGDLPVSGTVNNIEIFSTTTPSEYQSAYIVTATETTLITINGMGKIMRISWWCDYAGMQLKLYCDDVEITGRSLLHGFGVFTPTNISNAGYSASTPQIQKLTYNAGTEIWLSMDIPFEFSRNFIVKGYQESGVNKLIAVGVLYNKKV